MSFRNKRLKDVNETETPASPRVEPPRSPFQSGDEWDDAAVDSGFEDDDIFEEELPEGFSDQEGDEAVVQAPQASELPPLASGGHTEGTADAADPIAPVTSPADATPSKTNDNGLVPDACAATNPVGEAVASSQTAGHADPLAPSTKLEDAKDTGAMSDDSRASSGKRPPLTIQTDLAQGSKDGDDAKVEAVQGTGQTTASQ
ncbi:hypothetical protein HDZ31DRAFT_68111 [Schizophyllum fasciatum]